MSINPLRTAIAPLRVEPGIFHIHVDTVELPHELEEYCLHRLGMTNTDFSGHPEGRPHFEPTRHLTLKLRSGCAFQDAWRDLEATSSRSGLKGYLEGEYIARDEIIPGGDE